MNSRRCAALLLLFCMLFGSFAQPAAAVNSPSGVSVNTITISVVLDDGYIWEQTRYAGDPLSYVTKPTKTDFVCAGWTDMSGVPLHETTLLSQDISVKPVWEPAPSDAVEYQIHYYHQGADGAAYKLFDWERHYGAPGMTVAGSAKRYPGFAENINHADRKATGVVESDSDKLLILAFYYDRNAVDIIFEGADVPGQSVLYGGLAVRPEVDPVKDGYIFNGWKDADGNDFDFSARIYADTVIYASWISDAPEGDVEYTIERWFQNLSDDEYTLVESEKHTAAAGSTVDAPVTVYTGFTYRRDYARQKPIGEVKSDGSLVLELYYDRATYIVSFDDDNGNLATQAVRYQACAERPDDPERIGYIFDGWYDGDSLYDFTATVTHDVELTAKWAKNDTAVYQVHHFVQNTRGEGYSIYKSESFEVEPGVSVNAKPLDIVGTHVVEHESQNLRGVALADGSLVLCVYYDRDVLTVKVDNGTECKTYSIRHGDTETLESLAFEHQNDRKPEYLFGGWIDVNGKSVDFSRDIIGDITASWVIDTNYIPIPNTGVSEYTVTWLDIFRLFHYIFECVRDEFGWF